MSSRRQVRASGHVRHGRLLMTTAGTLAVALSAIASACGGDDAGDSAPPATTVGMGEQMTTTTLSQEDRVAAAYRAYWRMLERLSAEPDPTDPEIEKRATGSALGEVTDGLTTLQSLGRAARTGPQYSHQVLSVDISGKEAVVHDCAVDDSAVVDTSSGERLEGGTPATGLIEAALVRVGGHWKVAEVETLTTKEGIASCDEWES